ncbi:MAG: hypothetical protein ABEJ28_07520 [Salinigranum sp.]
MNRPTPGVSPPGYPDSWVVAHVGRRAIWNGGRRRCANCRARVDLSERHYYVELANDVDIDGYRLRTETERAVFCTPRCLDEWTAGR